MSRPTVQAWRQRFAPHGLNGLLDQPRPGAPRLITDVDVERVITTTLEAEPTGAATHWSTLDRTVLDDLEVHVVLDNAAIHKTPLIRRWLPQRPRYHLHFTTTLASWLNMVEGWFALLTRRQLQHGAFRSTQALETAIRHYLDASNADSKPFVWTETADAILDSIKGFCQRTSNSVHQ